MNFAKGFTFLELIITIAVVIMISTGTVAFYSRFYGQNALQNSVDQIVGELRKAQIYAMEGKQSGPWGVHNGTSKITLFQGATYALRDSTFDESFTINSPVVITGFTDVIFSRMTGTPSATTTITLTATPAAKTVTVNSMGIVSR